MDEVQRVQMSCQCGSALVLRWPFSGFRMRCGCGLAVEVQITPVGLEAV